MTHAYIVDAVRTPFGRYGGALSSVRADDLGAIPIRALMARSPKVDWAAVADVIYGCANQAGEDNRNVARMSALLAGLPIDVPGATLNRLCGSLRVHVADHGRGPMFFEAPGGLAGFESLLGTNPQHSPVLLQQCGYKLPSAKAESLLGYRPPVSFGDGLGTTLEWLKWTRH